MQLCQNEKILCVIPARGGSKRVPRKNLKLLHDKPLLQYPIEFAKNCGYDLHIAVTTEDPEIKEFALSQAVDVVDRPKELSTDFIPVCKPVIHAVEYYQKERKFDIKYVLIIQPSVCFVSDLISRVINRLSCRSGLIYPTGVVTVSRARKYHPRWAAPIDCSTGHIDLHDGVRISRSQELPDYGFFTGACFGFRPENLSQPLDEDDVYSIFGPFIFCVAIENEDYLDFDEEADFDYAEYVLSRRNPPGREMVTC